MRASRIATALAVVLTLVLGTVSSAPTAVAAEAPAAIRGQVLSSMDPIGFARVTVFDASTGAKLASVLTDGSGEYMVTGLPAVAVKVRASKAGYLDSWADNSPSRATARVFQLAPGATLVQSWDPLTLYLDLAPEGVVTGTVVGLRSALSTGSGRPLKGAKVVVVSGGTKLGSAVTDRQGRFRIGMLPAGEVEVRVSARRYGTASAPNHPPGQVVQFDVRAGDTTDVGMVRLYSTTTVYGYILWNMDPIPETSEVTVFNARTGKAIRKIVVPHWSSFQLDGLRPGRIELRVRAEGYLDCWWGPVTLRAGQVLGPDWADGAAVFELTREGVVTGSVMGFNNDPVAGWDDPLGGVQVRVVSSATGAVLGTAVTDSVGQFRVGKLPQGTVVVKAGYAPWRTTVWAPDQPTRSTASEYRVTSGNTTEVGLVQLFARASVAGTVTSGAHRVARARVTVYDALTRQPIGSTVATSHGRYRITGLWTGEFRQVKVRAARAGYRTTWADSAPGSSWDTATVFTLAPGVTLRRSVNPPVLVLELPRR